MTTINEAREAIYSRFVTMWGTNSPYTFDNEAYNAPASKWVRLSVRQIDAEQHTLGAIGNRKFLRQAAVWLQIFVPLNSGLKDADTLAQAFRTIFEGARFSDLSFREVVTNEATPDNQWYRVVAKAFFDYNELK